LRWIVEFWNFSARVCIHSLTAEFEKVQNTPIGEASFEERDGTTTQS